MAAVPSIGRANRVEGVAPAEADLTRALYEEYANQIFRYCLHQLGSREEAEDAVQSTFLNAFRGIKRGVVPGARVGVALQDRPQRLPLAPPLELAARPHRVAGRLRGGRGADAAPARRSDELIGLQDALEQMPESQRRAILLREWQGLSYREIAEELELSQAAVETLIFRARRALASGLEQPPEKQKRLARALDWGNAVAAIKSLLVGGSAAAKVAATVAVVSATTVVAASPVEQHRAHAPRRAGTGTPRHAPLRRSRPPWRNRPPPRPSSSPRPAPRRRAEAPRRASRARSPPVAHAHVAPETAAPGPPAAAEPCRRRGPRPPSGTASRGEASRHAREKRRAHGKGANRGVDRAAAARRCSRRRPRALQATAAKPGHASHGRRAAVTTRRPGLDAAGLDGRR